LSLSIIIVNYRSSEDICNCIASALEFPSAKSFEWIVIDNDSHDNSKEIITSKYPFVRWIAMPYNAGFARANNRGIEISTGESVLLLNPDTLILDDAIAKCYHRFMHSDYVACGVQLLNADRSPQITGNFFMKGGLNHLLPLPYLGPFLRTIAFAAKVKKTNVQQAEKEQKADWINGAFLMVKKTAIKAAGLMDEDFFLYAEEIEWCSRLKKIGDLCVYGDLYAIHLQGETINKATSTEDKGYTDIYSRKGLQLMVSQHVRIRKQFGRSWFIFHLLMHTIEIPLFFFFSFFDNAIHLKNPLKDSNSIRSFSYNVFKLYKLAPTIYKNKPHFYKMF
jgi:GT2 family glycosyltransferase